MAKVVNTFTKGKLNKDLDARLVPNGEYRDARNVQISKSEGPDVGELENVLGNEITSLTWSGNTRCIGWVVDEAKSFEITHEINIPRNAYINKALEFYNKFYQRKLLKKQLSEESKLVQANSMKMLKEFEEIQDDLFE